MKTSDFAPRSSLSLWLLAAGLAWPAGRLAAQAVVPVAPRAAPAPTEREEPILLSPFEIVGDTRGYYGANTMSGTRLNTKLEDLASSITVVTKEQMADFAMLDLNDIFNYEASTEGTGNYTDQLIDRNGYVSDNVQDNPQGANRVRGLAPANIAFNNFATSGRVPIDPIDIEAVEISRGPNSSIFGEGEGSGTVNLVGANANVSRSLSSTQFRVDSFGGWRTSLDLSRPIIPGKLGLRTSFVYQHDDSVRKPTGFDTRRFNVMLRAQPFKNTSINASFRSYRGVGNRPNSGTLRDGISYWRSVGSPTWDPVTSTVTVRGVSTVSGSTNPTGLAIQTEVNKPSRYIDRNGIGLWMINQMPAANATNGPNNVSGAQRLLETTPETIAVRLFSVPPGVASKEVYDWSSINLAAPNWIWDANDTSTVALDQCLLRTARHQVVLQLSWQREDADRINANMVGMAPGLRGRSNTIMIDPNSRLLDGSPNPFFMRPYIGIYLPQTMVLPYERDHYRSQLAYLADFNASKGWSKWLGRHSLSGYAEYDKSKRSEFQYRPVNITDNPVYGPAGQKKAARTVLPALKSYDRYYLGDATGQNVDYAPGHYGAGNQAAFRWYNPLTQQWVSDMSTIGLAATGEMISKQQPFQLKKTRGAIWQGYFWQNRIVPTLGFRHDESYSKYRIGKDDLGGYRITADGIDYDYAWADQYVPGDWQKRSGDTHTKGLVVKPARWFSLYYNLSSSFKPVEPKYSIFGDPLPNPSSEGKDYGLMLNLGEGRLVLRANKFQTTQINSDAGESGILAGRLFGVVYGTGNTPYDIISDWVAAAHPTWTEPQVNAETFNIMKVPAGEREAVEGKQVTDVSDVLARGLEFELNYNPPSRLWSLKFNASKNETLETNIGRDLARWYAERLPALRAIIDPRTNTPYTTTVYAGRPTFESALDSAVTAQYRAAAANAGKSKPQIRKWRFNATGRYSLRGLTESKYLKPVTVGGALRWEDRGAIGFYGIPVNGDIYQATALDKNRPVWDKAHYYADAFVTYHTRLFSDRVRARFQFNVRNLQEGGRLQPLSVYPDGRPYTYRIIDPRQFICSATFDL